MAISDELVAGLWEQSKSSPRYEETECPALCRAFLCLPTSHRVSDLPPRADTRILLV
jgi:hypothetical protein